MKMQPCTYECSSPLQKQESLTHARTWMKPKDIRVSEMCYTQKGTSHVRTFSREVLLRICVVVGRSHDFKEQVSLQDGASSFFFVFNFFHLFYILSTVSPPSSSPAPSPNSLLLTPHPLLLCVHSERGKPPMAWESPWHIKLGPDQVPPPASGLDEETQHREGVPQSQLRS